MCVSVEIAECILDHAEFFLEPLDVISCHSIGSDDGGGVTCSENL